MSGMIHAHVSSWAVALILFFVSYFLLRAGKAKGQKITHMILRLFFVLIVVTGGMMLVNYLQVGIVEVSLFIKALLGIWVIGAMEMTLVRRKKGASTTGPWIQFVIALILVFIFGYMILG
ncbi:YisL family protein [Alkalihalobacillus sp. AL-G]|uniref:YisL family protein n=1 Tax=Alkalihalobacillus sp. AL-G TaxID=2926399 RepID=UPI00272C8BE5|nr:YisL family protein [Alkalihalobacillus sp. AL-G]WLD94850.1 YisL family protein [Alkalihalobacillus sp. AL-G]